MKTRRQQKTEENQKAARRQYDAYREGIEAKLERIRLAVINHDPGQVTWPHVGDLMRVDELLTDTENFLNNYPDEQ
jgi:hypothetical protein